MISAGTEDVRLSKAERAGILAAVESAAERLSFQWTSIAVFGSRADPSGKGGDIDLYIRLISHPAVRLFNLRNLLRQEITDRLGDQKVDLILDVGGSDLGAFGELIARQKRELWTK